MKVKTENQEKNKITDLILVSFGILEYENGDYFGKSAVINYAHEISKYFDKTYFLCFFHKNKNYFNTKLDTNKVEPVEIGFDPRANSLSQLWCLVKDQIRLAKLVTKRTGVIINSPMIWFTPILPLLALKSGHLCGYMAGNPEGIARLQSSEGGIANIIKSKITILCGKSISILSDSLLIRGDISPYQKYGSKLHESKSIMVLTRKQSQVGNDTCNRKNVTLLYVGGLSKNKGVDVLIRAFSNLTKNDSLNKKTFKLKIIGDGSEYTKLRATAHELNVNDKTEFLGYIDDQERLALEYSSSAIFVLPTITTEAGPRVVDEAHYYGVPVIATNHRYGNSFEHKKNIFFVIPNSVMELEKAIEEIIKNDGLRRKMIGNGKKRIEKVMGNESAAEQHARIVRGNRGDGDMLLKKVNLGSGTACLDEWINIDGSFNARLAKYPRLRYLLLKISILPKKYYELPWSEHIKSIMVRDVRKKLPFDDESIDFIYSSHLIEHLRKDETKKVLGECLRVLKRGGFLRLVIPDLEILTKNYLKEIEEIENINKVKKNYLPSERFLELLGLGERTRTPFLQKIFSSGGHKWMYDHLSLTKMLATCGFVDIQKKDYKMGTVPDIDLLDNRPEHSLYLETRKP
jgi:glycosyltransferase involved in cell wall biosynthesis/predicted SAM-dependent methyltransferase